MASKMKHIFELSADTAKGLSGYESWIAFLRCAAWQYKYPFEDQLLIYAQRPEARACATFDVWNKKLHRWINRGSKGIALLRENDRGFHLTYVFDISDTNSYYNNEVKLWQYNDKYDTPVIETLENTFGELSANATIVEAVTCAAHNAVMESKTDYLKELQYAKETSFLEDIDSLNLDVEFQQTAEVSIAYMIMQRMGLGPDMVFDREDFQHIVDFNTPQTITVLGNAVSSIAEEALRSISQTIRVAERVEKNQSKIFAKPEPAVYNQNKENQTDNVATERNDTDGRRIDIQQGGRLSDTEPDNPGRTADARQIRADEIEISQRQQAEPIQQSEDNGQTIRPLGGDRQDSERTDTADSRGDGKSRRRNRRTESSRSDSVDGIDEQSFTFGGGNRAAGGDLQLSLFDLIPTEEQQKESIQRAAQEIFGAAFSMPQQIIDEVLCDGTNEKDSVLRTCIEFSKNKTLSEKAEYLKSEYGTDGKGFLLNGSKVSALWDKDGIRISYGTSAKNANTVLSWEDAAKRVDELLDIGRFAPTEILLQMRDYELRYVSKAFWNQYSNLDFEEYPEIRNLFDDEMTKGGYPEREERTTNALKTPEGLTKLQGIAHRIGEMYLENPAIMRYRVKQNPTGVDTLLSDLSLERKTYTAENAMRTPPNRYITDDEINRLLCGGSGVSGGKLRIYQFFNENADKKERIAFLKDEYGWGGRYDDTGVSI